MTKYECPECGWENFRQVRDILCQCTKCNSLVLAPEGANLHKFLEYEGSIGGIKYIIVEEEVS